MHLIIKMPDNYINERKYVTKIIINKMLCLEYTLLFSKCRTTEIRMQSDNYKKKLCLSDNLFQNPKEFWLTHHSLPQKKLKVWNNSKNDLRINNYSLNIPVIYGNNPAAPEFCRVNENNINLGLDIFGSSFFMLTRYEEFVKPDRDKHGRFPASATLAHQEGLLGRPIINEYVEILWCCLKHLWPDLKREIRQPRIILNHDVDNPYYYAFMPLVKNLRACVGDIIKRKSLTLSAKRFYDWCMVKKGLINKDNYNNFDMIMDASEKYNVESTFYFQSAGNNLFDGNYELEHPLIKKLIQNIHDRGHQIGLHPSYDSFLSPDKIKGEFARLKSVCEDLGIKQEEWGGRQHYLRWKVPYTWQYYEEAGLNYDSSLTYADYAGFRCGICCEFPVFNLLTRQELKLVERPLIVMECSLYDQKYMGLNIEEAFQYTRRLIDVCKLFNGNFALLWHNSRLISYGEINLFNKILEYFHTGQ